MPKYTSNGCIRYGFTLIQLAVSMTVLSLAVASSLPSIYGGQSLQREELTLQRIKAIEQALSGYSAATRTYPCPADASLNFTNAAFGKPMGVEGVCAGGNFGSSNNVVAGAVPTRVLGLPDDHALDGFGKRFTYFVDTRTTTVVDTIPASAWLSISCTAGTKDVKISSPFPHHMKTGDTMSIVGWPLLAALTCPSLNVLGTRTVTQVISPTEFVFQQSSNAILSLSITINGVNLSKSSGQDCSDIANSLAIQVRQYNGSIQKAAVAIVSHGGNGHGAFPSAGSLANNRYNNYSNDADELDNASVTSNFATSFDNVIVAKNMNKTFDDIVRYSTSCTQ